MKTDAEKFEYTRNLILKYFRKLSPERMKIIEDEIIRIRKVREKIINNEGEKQ